MSLNSTDDNDWSQTLMTMIGTLITMIGYIDNNDWHIDYNDYTGITRTYHMNKLNETTLSLSRRRTLTTPPEHRWFRQWYNLSIVDAFLVTAIHHKL